MDWFTIDRGGLAKILARKGVTYVVLEPLSNAWDEQVTQVDVTLERIPGTRSVRLTVQDDSPDGFQDLSHAYTLFANSKKKGDPTARGRFNAGDKLVLAMATSASIASTTGTIVFDEQGRHRSRAKTERGSIFSCVLKLTAEQMAECVDVVSRLIPPAGVRTTFNGVMLQQREPLSVFSASLSTELADDEGYLRRATRETLVSIYEPREGEAATLYELGVPVCPLGDDRFHVNIGQKVPLDLERTSVPQAYLSKVRALVLDAASDRIASDDAAAPWVRQAMHTHSDMLSDQTIQRVTKLRFGEKVVAYDPSDPEANNLAVAQGFRVVHGGALSKPEWDAVKRAGALLPAGRVTPSPKPFSDGGKPLVFLAEDRWDAGMRSTIAYFHATSEKLLGRKIRIDVVSDITWPFLATFGGDHLILNLGRLGHRWFDAPLVKRNELLLHELAHAFSENHLSEAYHSALSRLGAQLAQLAIDDPGFFHGA